MHRASLASRKYYVQQCTRRALRTCICDLVGLSSTSTIFQMVGKTSLNVSESNPPYCPAASKSKALGAALLLASKSWWFCSITEDSILRVVDSGTSELIPVPQKCWISLESPDFPIYNPTEDPCTSCVELLDSFDRWLRNPPYLSAKYNITHS